MKGNGKNYSHQNKENSGKDSPKSWIDQTTRK